MEFGVRLRTMRNLRGLKQKELSQACGMSQSMISLFETGEKTATTEQEITIKAALGWPSDEAFKALEETP